MRRRAKEALRLRYGTGDLRPEENRRSYSLDNGGGHRRRVLPPRRRRSVLQEKQSRRRRGRTVEADGVPEAELHGGRRRRVSLEDGQHPRDGVDGDGVQGRDAERGGHRGEEALGEEQGEREDPAAEERRARGGRRVRPRAPPEHRPAPRMLLEPGVHDASVRVHAQRELGRSPPRRG